MPFEKLFERFIASFLSPYVDGISHEKLKFSASSSASLFSWNDVKVKENALQLLSGRSGLHVRKGAIGKILLKVPFQDFFNGKLQIEIQDVVFEVDDKKVNSTISDEEQISEYRANREKAITERMKQLQLLLQEQEDGTKQDSGNGSLLSRIGRKILCNFEMKLESVRLQLGSHYEIGVGVEFDGLTCTSHSPTSNEPEDTASVMHLSKLIRLEGIAVDMSKPNRSTLEGGERIITKTNTELCVDWADKKLALSLKVEASASILAGLLIKRSQLKHLRKIITLSGQDKRKLMAKIITPEDEKSIYENAKSAKEEYKKLYRRSLLHSWGHHDLGQENDEDTNEPLSLDEGKRLFVLEDALAIVTIAKVRYLVRESVQRHREKAFSVKDLERNRSYSQASYGYSFYNLFTRGLTQEQISEKLNEHGSEGNFTAADKQFLHDIQNEYEEKLEKISPPTTYDISCQISSYAIDLVDDRWSNEVQRNLLSLAIKEVSSTFKINFDTDFNGMDSLNWSADFKLMTFNLLHGGEVIASFFQDNEDSWQRAMQEPQVAWSGDGQTALLCKVAQSSGRRSISSVMEDEVVSRQDASVIKLDFQFAPIVVKWSYGLLDQILEFTRAPEVEKANSEKANTEKDKNPGIFATIMKGVEYHREEIQEFAKIADSNYMNMSTTWRPNADEVNRSSTWHPKAYEAPPTKLDINFEFASPIVQVPVQHLGMSVFTLGKLKVTTPKPCPYTDLALNVVLSKAQLRAEALKGECLIQPVEVRIDVIYKNEDARNFLKLSISWGRMSTALSPRALQVLISTPMAMIAVMWEKYKELKEKAADVAADVNLEDDDEEPEDSEAQSIVRQLSRLTFKMEHEPEDSDGEESSSNKALERKVSSDDIARTVSFLSFEGSTTKKKKAAVELARQTESLIGARATKMLQEGATKMLEEVQRVVETEKKKPFEMELELSFDEIELMLLDHAEPAMRFHGELPKNDKDEAAFQMTFCNNPKEMKINIENGILEWDCLNSQSGVWEPLGERFHLDTSIVWIKASDTSQKLNVTVKGRQQLLINLTPNALQQCGYLLPQFAQALMFCPLESRANTFAALNLTGHDMQLVFYASKNDQDAPCGEPVLLRPTGSEWESIDGHVHSRFAKSVMIKFDGKVSRLLYLDCPGSAVGIPGSNIVLELRTPRPNHRLLIVATTLRLHNKTDLPMLIRFANQSGSFMNPVGKFLDSTTCYASYFGDDVEERLCSSKEGSLIGGTGHLDDEPCDGSFLLKPNRICSVPAAFIKSENDRRDRCRLRRSRVWLRMRPLLPDIKYSSAIEVGDFKATSDVLASQDGMPAQVVSCGDVHFICGGRSEVHFLPSATAIATITLKPTLALINAMPFGSLVVRYTSAIGTQADTVLDHHGSDAKVPSLCCLNLYNVPSVLQQGICLKTRFVLRGSTAEDVPWSKHITFGRDAHKENCREVIPIRHCSSGAEAGLVVEASAPMEFRFSSSSWFVDRSGLREEVQVQYKKKSLPCENGITLLPAETYNSEWQEVTCELVLPRKLGSLKTGCASQELRFPPDFCILPWNTPLGPCVFCVQCDEVDSGDVLGAQCSVIMLRPRLILTNSSDQDLELRFPGKIARLPAGKSIPLHHPNASGEKISLEFRPLECGHRWSGTVICSDEHVGSVPFLFPPPRIDVWTVEVSPARGSLAVSFRHGSEFTVVNKTSRLLTLFLARAKKEIQMNVPPTGDEIPFGWYQPHKDSSRSVRFSGSSNVITVPDVRNTSVRNRSYRIDRISGIKYVLSLLYAPTASGSDFALKDFTVELKLNRLGISIVGQQPKPQELFFIRADLLRFLWQRKTSETEDIQTFGLVISEVQADCQLPGRIDSSKSEDVENERPVVVFANCAKGNRAFLELKIKKQYTGARELMFPLLDLAVDAVDITIDDDWILPLQKFLKQSGLISNSKSGKAGMNVAYVRKMAGKSIIDDYSPPALPRTFNLDLFRISELRATVWCGVSLQTLWFLKGMVRDAIKILSFNSELKLDAAFLKLEPKQTRKYRGSLADFGRFLATEYTHGILSGAASALGKSSLLKLPRLPITLGSSAISYFTTGIGLIAGEAASLLDRFTLDDEYVSQQRMIRENKDISSVSDGLAEAAKSLTDGGWGFTDICKKPVVGAQEEGVGGFCAGVGRGALSGFVKPMSGLGQAISDIGTGISAQLSPNEGAMKRIRGRGRLRNARLLFTELGALRPYSRMHAKLLADCGDYKMRGIQEVLPIYDRSDAFMLLLFSDKFILVKIDNRSGYSDERRHADSSASIAETSILEAAENAAEKLIGHGLLPVEKLYRGIMDIAGQNDSDSSNGDSPNCQFKEERLDQFAKIDVLDGDSDDCKFMSLIDKKGKPHKFPIYADHLFNLEKVAQALSHGLNSAAIHPDGFASWALLQQTLREESRTRRDRDLANNKDEFSAGQREIVVFEVERRTPLGDWTTAWLPLDRELSYRWVNAQGCRHPNLKKDATRAEIANLRRPDSVIDFETDHSMFKPVAGSEWLCEVTGQTDSEGWRYGLAWNSSTWDPAETLFSGLRRRRWLRTYE